MSAQTRQRVHPVLVSRSLQIHLGAEALLVLSVWSADVPCGRNTVRPSRTYVNRSVRNPQDVPNDSWLSPANAWFSTGFRTVRPQRWASGQMLRPAVGWRM